MPKLKPDTQRARREHILDAAEVCFARAGFHRSTMHDICKEARISPGALYLYFESKEDLIAGIAERDRQKLAEELAEVAKAPDFLASLGQLGDHYMIEKPQHKRVLCIEIGCEATRNRAVGEIFRSVDNFVLDNFEAIVARAHAEGKIAPALDHRTIAEIIGTIGDGLFWRLAVNPGFDAKRVMPGVMGLIGTLLNPTQNTGDEAPASKSRGAKP